MHHLHLIPHLIIVLCYVAFAVQLYYQAGSALVQTKGGRAVTALILVFLLCAVTGYAADLIDVGPTIDLVLHIMLAAAASWLVLSNTTAAIAVLMEGQRP